MTPKSCQGCEKCGTGYASGPDSHKPIEPHDFNDRKIIEDGVEEDDSYCKRCFKFRRHLKKEQDVPSNSKG